LEDEMDIRGIGYVGFESAEISAWRDYGPQVLGMGVAASPEDEPDSLYLRMDDRRYRLAFHPGPIDKLAYIGWEAIGRVAFLNGVAKLRAEGIEVEMGDTALAAKRGVREVARFKDPIGFQYELFYGQKFDPRSFVPGRPHGGYITEERGFGHLVVITPEYTDELENFLLNIMGFHWYGFGAGKGRTGFFRAKLNDKSSHDIGYGFGPGRMGIQHIGIFVKSVRDVGETYDLVKSHQLQMQMTLGQHTQDPHFSFYHFSPSGFAVETIAELTPWPGDAFELNPERLSSWGHELVGPILGPSVRTPEELRQT
jgi:2,3-dihydroxybiphenyl 1,2-dioxygenase